LKSLSAMPSLFVAVLATAAVAACGSPGTSPQASDSTLTTQPPATTTTTSQLVSGDETQQLCDQIKGALPDWRIQTPSLTHPALNVLVQTWGIQHGVTADIVGNRKIIDDITEEQCADTRNEALSALELPDFASGLIGLG
jgi:hypothetical protein